MRVVDFKQEDSRFMKVYSDICEAIKKHGDVIGKSVFGIKNDRGLLIAGSEIDGVMVLTVKISENECDEYKIRIQRKASQIDLDDEKE